MQEGLGAAHEQLAALRERVRALFEELQPDVVLTWNASGWTGHHDHRLVSAVVTEVFSLSRRWVRPSQLYYAAIPNGARPAEGPMSLATVDESYLTVTVPLSDADWARARDAWSCHASQYTPAAIDALHRSLQQAWKDGPRSHPLLPAPPAPASLF